MTRGMARLQGKVAFLTGAGSGIARATNCAGGSKVEDGLLHELRGG